MGQRHSSALLLVNRNAQAVAVSCTFVDGLVQEYYTLAGIPGGPAYYPKSIAILPGRLPSSAGKPTSSRWTPSRRP